MTGCERHECQAIHKEFKLLTAEVDELEAENEELHEALEGVKKERVHNTANGSSRTNKSNFDENSSKSQKIELDSLHDELNQIKSELQQAKHKESSVSKELAQQQAEMRSLKQENQTLQSDVEEKNQLLVKESRKMKQISASAKESALEKKDKRSEFIKVLKENEDQQKDIYQLKETLQKVSTVTLEYEQIIKSKDKELKDIMDTLAVHENELQAFQTKVLNLEAEKGQLQDKLLEMDEAEAAIDSLIEEHQARHEKERKEWNLQLEKAHRELKLTQSQAQPGSSSSDSKTLPDTSTQQYAVEKHGEAMNQLKKELKRCQNQLQQRELDLETVMEQHVNIKDVVEAAVTDALESEKALRKELKSEIQQYKQRCTDQRELLTEAEKQLQTCERDKMELEAWKHEYEAGAGLEEVLKFQKKLKAELRQREQDNVDLRHKLSEQLEACGKLHTSFQKLKEECGKPADFQYPENDIKEEMKGQVAAAHAIIRELENQLDDLEEERLRLLKTLRQNAKLHATSFEKHFGLSNPDHMILLQEFIEKLKSNSDLSSNLADLSSVTLQPRMKQFQDEIQKLRIQLAKSEAQIETFENQLSSKSSSSPAPTPRQSHQDSSTKEEERQLIEKLQQELHTVSTLQKQLLAAATLHSQKPPSTNEAPISTSEAVLSTPDQPQQKMQDDSLTGEKETTSVPDDVGISQEEEQFLSVPSIKIEAAPPAYDINPTAIAEATATAVAEVLSSAQQLFSASSVKTINTGDAVSPSHSSLMFADEKEMNELMEMAMRWNQSVEELQEKDTQVQELEKLVHQYEEWFESFQDQKHSLYVDYYAKVQQASSNADSKHKLELEQLQGKIIAATAESDAMGTSNSNGTSSLKQITMLEVENHQLHRENQIIKDEIKISQSKRKVLEEQFCEMEQTLKSRILMLEQWKKICIEKQQQDESLNTQKHWVPMPEYVQCQNQQIFYQKQYKKCLQREVNIRREWTKCRHLPLLVAKLKSQISVSLAKGEKKSEKSGQASELEVRIQALEIELEEAMKKYHALQDHSQQQAIAFEEKMMKVQEKTQAGTVTSLTEEGQPREESLQTNEEQKELPLDAHQLKTLQQIELLTIQNQKLLQWKERHDHQVEDLNQALREQSCINDNHTLLGKVQQQYLNIKSTYQQVVQHNANLTALVREKEISLHQLEQQCWNISQQLQCQEQKLTKEIDISRQAQILFKQATFDQQVEQLNDWNEQMVALQSQLEQQIAALSPGSGSGSSMRKTATVSNTRKENEYGTFSPVSLPQDSSVVVPPKEQQQQDPSSSLLHKLQSSQQHSQELMKENHQLKKQHRELQMQFEKQTFEIQQLELKLQEIPIQSSSVTLDVVTQPSEVTTQANTAEQKSQFQKAAQVTIANLKLLLQEKNQQYEHLNSKFELKEKQWQLERQQNQHEFEHLNEQMFQENQQQIDQLRQATEEMAVSKQSGKLSSRSSSASTAQQEELAQLAQLLIEKDQLIDRISEQSKVCQRERELAELHAGETLEKITHLKSELREQQLEFEKQMARFPTLCRSLKTQLRQKEKKLGALRQAVIQLKEEFILMEERHGVEQESQEHQHHQHQLQLKKEKQHELTVAKDKIDFLQNQLMLTQKEQQKKRTEAQKESSSDNNPEEVISSLTLELQQLSDEKQELQHKLSAQDKQHSKDQDLALKQQLKEAEKQIRLLSAQNIALRQDDPRPSTYKDKTQNNKSQDKEMKKWTLQQKQLAEKEQQKQKRRNDILQMRLTEAKREKEVLESQLQQSRKTCAQLQETNSQSQPQDRIEPPSREKPLPPGLIMKLEPLREQVFQLEKEKRDLEQELQVEVPNRLKTIERQNQVLEQRLRKLDQNSLHVENENDEDTQKKDSRRRIERLLLEKEALVVEFRFENETLRLDLERYARRCVELEQYLSAATNGSKRSSPGPNSNHLLTQISSSSHNPKEERVIQSLKQVIEKLQRDNMRLEKNRSSETQFMEQKKHLRKVRNQVDVLESEKQDLVSKCQRLEHSRTKLRQLEEANQQLKRQLRLKTTESQAMIEKVRESEALVDFEAQKQPQKENHDIHHHASEKKRIRQLEKRIANLQEEVEDSRGSSTGAGKKVQQEWLALEKENERLRTELSAFDADFFEEIEDLKYKYAQAREHIQSLERS